MLLLGAGPRALLLQIAHPAVAAGVNDHSDFRADPWRRLAGTLRSYLTIVYGSTGAARAEIRRLNTLHRGITGPGYAARDPELSLWVHATLVDSTMAVADAWLEPLSQERRASYYAETLPIGRAFGVPDALLPPDIAAFDRYVAAMLAPDGPVRVSPIARELAGVILRPPLAPLAPLLPLPTAAARSVLARVPPATYSWTLWPSVGLLPPIRPRRLRPCVGRPRAGRVGLAGRRVPCLATAPARVLPADAQGTRRGSADERRRELAPSRCRTPRPRSRPSRPSVPAPAGPTSTGSCGR